MAIPKKGEVIERRGKKYEVKRFSLSSGGYSGSDKIQLRNTV